MRPLLRTLALLCCSLPLLAVGQIVPQTIDIPTRPQTTQRLLVLGPANAKATVVLMAGGHGGLQIQPGGSMKWGEGNFVVRTRQMFAEQGMQVVVLDAPSDRQSPPFLSGFRQTAEHLADLRATVAWARSTYRLPVWLVGTSRGTQSAAFAATELQGADAPDGVVLTSSILSDPRSRPVPALPLEKVRIPVLVVHHVQDGCALCAYSDLPQLMGRLTQSPRTQLLSFNGGQTKGDPCEAFAYHGYNGIEAEVVQQITAWISVR